MWIKAGRPRGIRNATADAEANAEEPTRATHRTE